VTGVESESDRYVRNRHMFDWRPTSIVRANVQIRGRKPAANRRTDLQVSQYGWLRRCMLWWAKTH